MGEPRLYLSTDGNAPILRGDRRTSFISVLKACLVDGYGDKPGAGWTMPFINLAETRACFRNNGTGFFLMVDGATPSSTYDVDLAAYEAMTSESVGFNQFGNTTDLGYYFSETSNSTARPWICVASDTYVYLFNYRFKTTIPLLVADVSAYEGMGVNFFFGDFEKAYADDGFACAFFISTYAGGGRIGFGDLNYNEFEGHHIARSITGAPGLIRPQVLASPPSWNANYTNSQASGYGASGPPNDGKVPFMVSKILLTNGTNGSFRGYLPGLIAPCHPFPYNNIDRLTINDEKYIVVTWRTTNNEGRIAQAFLKYVE